MSQKLIVQVLVEAEILKSSLKTFSKLILFGTLVTIALLGSFTPSLGFADVFGQSHARCRNEAPLLPFSIPSTDSEAFGNRASSRSCSFDYSISLSQTSASLVQGMNISLTVSLSLSRGIAGPVDLSLGQRPDGLKIGLDPSTGQPPFDSQLRISAGPVSPIGSFSIVITGLSPTAGTHRAILSLTLRATGPAPS